LLTILIFSIKSRINLEIAGWKVMGRFRLFSKNHWNFAIGVASVALIAYVAFLLLANYRFQAGLQRAAFEQMSLVTEKHAMLLAYFFEARKRDLRDLSRDQRILTFFENKALGMSMEYGLRANLIAIDEALSQLARTRVMDGEEIYSRIVLLDRTGRLLADTLHAASEPREWRSFLSPEMDDAVIRTESNGRALETLETMVTMPLRLRGEYCGQIVAWLSNDTMCRHFVQMPRGASTRMLYLTSARGDFKLAGNSEYAGRLSELPGPDAVEPGKVQRFEITDEYGDHEEMLVNLHPIKDTSFLLGNVATVSELMGGVALRQIPLAMVLLSILVLGGILIIWKISMYNLVLNTRLDEAAKIRQAVERENWKLEKEIAERKRAEEALRESERQLKILSSELLKVQENERKRIANEIHDSVGQSLHAIKLGVEGLMHHVEEGTTPEWQPMRNLLISINFAIEEVRNIYMELRPSLLDDLGVLAATKWFLREFRKMYPEIGIEEDITVREDEVPEDLKIVLFRTLQGAMENIARHSQSCLARVTFGKMNGRFELAVEDRGIGFDSEDVLSMEVLNRGIGLAAMQERIESSGGTFALRSAKGEGTAIRASWPVGETSN
jgi:signal transduction histidine kinase